MIASGLMPRSPVWLRKIPSTVSGSQGSRRGFAARRALRVPAWRKIEYYLARSAVSRTFFRKFFPAVPRAAGRPAFRASALRGGEFGIIRAPGATRGAGNPPAHRMPTTPARRSGRMAGDFGWEGGIGLALRPAPQPRRFAPAHRRDRPGGPALARLGPPGHSIRPRTFNHLYISRRDWARLQAKSPPTFIMQATLPLSLALPHSPSSNFSRSEYQP